MKKIIALFCLINIPIFSQNNTEFYQKFTILAPKTVGLKKFPTINHYRYNEDCSGFVAFLFHLTGLNLIKMYGIGTSGVVAIWDGLKKFNFILDDIDLQVGDIIFFDNTYDKNKNGLWANLWKTGQTNVHCRCFKALISKTNRKTTENTH